ncbi:hypothetical protein [Streptomyces clavuligerus]|uniref:hypothetical protein n=1 Tax=Streptomyces clavuligerus TaxID=1901 RepID=UPI001F072B0B|nr:hypothetical protein [Streptomyces clavuligerus]
MPSVKTTARPGGSETIWRGLGLVQVHGGTDGGAVVSGGQSVDDLERGVLDDVRSDLRGDLFGDDDAFAIGTDLGEERGEEFDGVGRG